MAAPPRCGDQRRVQRLDGLVGCIMGVWLDAVPEKGFRLRMRNSGFAASLNSSALAGAPLLVASCKPKEATPAIPATNHSPVISVPAPIPVTNPVAINSVASATVLTPEEAKNHVGEIATVRGKVFSVYVSQKGNVYLNFGVKHPNAPFRAVCFNQAIPTDQLKELDGKIISVRGKIKDYNGQIETILETAEQILR